MRYNVSQSNHSFERDHVSIFYTRRSWSNWIFRIMRHPITCATCVRRAQHVSRPISHCDYQAHGAPRYNTRQPAQPSLGRLGVQRCRHERTADHMGANTVTASQLSATWTCYASSPLSALAAASTNSRMCCNQTDQPLDKNGTRCRAHAVLSNWRSRS